MTYHYHYSTGQITTKPRKSVYYPITNILYNIIIQEAIKLKLQPYISHAECLCIELTSHTVLIFSNDNIRCANNYNVTYISYEHYTTLEELIQKCTTTTSKE